MDAIQAKLGEALLLLASLAVVLLALIVVLVEADCILRLGGRLTRRWRSSGATVREPAGQADPEEKKG